MWDRSRPAGPGSKWRRPTLAQLDQQARTALALRAETAALEIGWAVPVPKRRPRTKRQDGGGAAFGPARAAELWGFLGVHGREIAGVLGRAGNKRETLEIAAAYQAVLEAAPGAHEAWARVLSRCPRSPN